MAVATVEFYSRILQKNVPYSIVLPEVGPGPYPVLLQLHGHGESHLSWLYNTRLAHYARVHNMIIVLPDGGTSFYLNLDEPMSFRKWHSQRYEDFIVQDLWQHINNTYQVRSDRWAIGGNSMGGYGAMRLGCKYSEQFLSIRAQSGTYLSADELEDVVPDHEDADIFATITQLVNTSQHIPEIAFDCGTEDVGLDYSRRLHAHMDQLGLSHQYIEQPGDHTWAYWDQHLPETLAQHASVFERQ